jgi:hypothetical protein
MAAKRDQLVQAGMQSSLPEGFQRSTSANAAGWFNMSLVGNILSGKLTGMFTRKDGMRVEGTSKFFQVQIDKPCQVRAERGEEAKYVDAQPGDFVNVNYGPKTKPWEDFVADIKNGAEYAVFGVILGGKLKIGGGRNMHNFDTGHKVIVPPREQSDVGEAFEDPTGSETS